MLTQQQKIEAAERGAEWGRQEAGHQVEAVENGHRQEPATWATGQWCGDNPFPTDDDRCWEYDSALDRAAQAAYEAAVEAAKPLYRVRYTLSTDDLGEHAVRSVGDGYPGGDEYSKYDSEAEAKASIIATFGDHGEWIDEDGRTHYHTSPEDGCGSAWVEVAQ